MTAAEIISAVAMLVVIAAVFAGFIRLALDRWEYISLLIAAAVGAGYLYNRLHAVKRR